MPYCQNGTIGTLPLFLHTICCREKWPEVFTSIFHSHGKIEKIIYLKGWEYDENLILVVTKDEKEWKLPDYLKNSPEMRDKHKFYKDEFLLITRIFDNRVKAFISHILMANKDVEHYSYRIGKSTF